MSDIDGILIDGQNVDKVALRNYLAVMELFQDDLGGPNGATKIGNGVTTVAATLTALQAGQSSGVIGKDTLANLNADLAHAANTIAYVTNDPTPANNGVYRKSGASGSGSWVAGSFDRVALVEAIANRYVEYLERGIGRRAGWPDPFFRMVDLTDGIFLDRDRWWKNTGVTNILLKWSLVANTVFDGNALRNANVGGADQLSGPAIWLDDFNAAAGDTVTIYTLWVGSGNVINSPGLWLDAAGTAIGGQVNPVNSTGGSTIASASATPAWLRHVMTVPSGAVRFGLFPYVGSGTADMVALWAFKGDQTKGPSWPSLDVTPRINLLQATVDAIKTANTATDAKLAYAITDVTEVGWATKTVQTAVSQIYARPRDIEFCGWGQKFTPQGVSFNAVRLPAFQQIVTTEASRWKHINVFVRVGATPANSGTIVARGAARINESLNYQEDVYILLRDPVTNAVKTLTNADLGSAYMFAMHATNAAGERAATGSNEGVTVGHAGESFFFLTANGTTPEAGAWDPFSGNIPLAFEHLLLTTPVESLAYAPTATLGIDLGVDDFVPEVVMPPVLFGLESMETNLYLDNLLLNDYKKYDFKMSTAVTGGARQQLNERFKWIPAGAVASGALALDVISRDSGLVLKSSSINLRAAAASAGTGLNKKVIVVGDSLIAAGTITQVLVDLAGPDVMDITLIGTQGTGANKHEGRGGWTVETYTTNYSDVTYGANPFWHGGAVNFATYLTTNSFAVPDWVLIQLGINDVYSAADDVAARNTAQAAFVLLDTLIASAKAAGAGIKVGLMIPPPPSYEQDAFGLSAALGETRARFKRNIVIWARELIAKYTGQEANRIYIVPSNVNLDTENNMSTASSAAVNARSSVNKARQNNGVHPGTDGYEQIGDAVWAFLKFYA